MKKYIKPYIYIITDTRNNLSVVGKSNGKSKYYFTGSQIINSILKKYGKYEARKFLKKSIIVQGNFNEELLNELEKHYIRLYNTKFPNGYNLTDGGIGNQNFPEYIRKNIGKVNVGNKYSVGRIHTEEAKRKISEGHTKLLPTEEVVQLYGDGSTLATLATKYGVTASTIRLRLIKNNIKLRDSKEASLIANRSSLTKKVRQMDREGNVIAEFDCIQTATKKYGYHYTSINKALSKKGYLYGCKWEYVN